MERNILRSVLDRRFMTWNITKIPRGPQLQSPTRNFRLDAVETALTSFHDRPNLLVLLSRATDSSC